MSDFVVEHPQTPTVVKPPFRSFEVHLLVAVFLVSVLFIIARATVPFWQKDVINKSYEIVQMTVLRPDIVRLLDYLMIFSALAIAVVGVWLCFRRRTALGITVIVLSIGAFPIPFICSFMIDPAPWTTKAEIAGPDGRTYYFMDSIFLQGQTMALTYLEREGWFTRTMRVVGTNNGDFPRSWASVIRPAGAPKRDYGQLYVSESGLIVGIRYDHKCFLAYEPKNGRFFGHGDVEKLSPFVLIGSDTPLHEPDIESIIQEVRRSAGSIVGSPDIRVTAGYLGDDTFSGYPKGETLTAGLEHPNSAVREAAKRILDIHRAFIEKAQARVAKHVQVLIGQLASQDSNVRSGAASGLGDIGSPGAEEAIPVLAAALRDENTGVRIYAAQSLGLIGRPAVPSLLELLKDKDESVRHYALFGLQAAGPAAAPAIPALIETLKDENAVMRADAAKALGSIGPAAKVAVPALIGAMRDKDADVRSFTAGALGEIGPQAQAAIPILNEALNDQDEAVRRTAVYALEKIGHNL